MRRLGVVGALALTVLLATAAPASAHAELRSSVPANGAALQEAPRQVVLRFSQEVEITFGSVRIFDAEARRIDDGRAGHPPGDDRSVVVSLPALADGPYVVTWRVVSADAHPARGAFTFHVGPTPATAGQDLARRLLAAGGGSALAGGIYSLIRLVGFGALLVFVGGLWFVTFVWPVGRGSDRARKVLLWAGLLALTSTVAAVGLQGVTSAGLPLSHAMRPSVIAAVLDSRFGRLAAARFVVLALCLVLVVRGVVKPARRRVVVGGLGLAAVTTLSLSGHAASGWLIPLAVVADVVHLSALCVWLGGLSMVACCLLRADVDEIGTVLRRFSRSAFLAVAAIVVSGAFQGWRQVGSLDALTSTTYGRLLATKVALFAALIAVAAASRRAVKRRWPLPPPSGEVATSPAVSLPMGPGARRADPDAAVLSRLRRSVGAEVAVAVAVLAVAAVLVNVVPARTAFARPYSVDVDAGRLLISVTVDPARAGPADLHLYTLSPAGAVADVDSLSARLSLPAHDIPPLDVPLRRAGPGHFAAYGFTVPVAGTWELDLVAWTSTTDFLEATTSVPVR